MFNAMHFLCAKHNYLSVWEMREYQFLNVCGIEGQRGFALSKCESTRESYF